MAIPTVRMVLIHTGKILKGTYQQFTTDELKKDKAAWLILKLQCYETIEYRRYIVEIACSIV